MSFICQKCGTAKNGERCYLVVSKIREVIYNLQVKTIFANKEVVKTVKSTKGSEIVEELAYCKKCLPKDNKPKIIEKISRNQLINTILKLRRKVEEEDE